jgi:ribosomal protein S18 acetylase RimI-like enzyme
MDADLFVREATADDYLALNALWAEADLLHHEGLPDVFAPPAEPARSVEFVDSILHDPNQKLLVATANDRIAGFVRVTLQDRRAPLAPGRIAIVEEVVVTADFRGAGIGRRLMAEAEAWAKNNGATELWLNVWEFNESAIAFYAALGFETMSLRMRKEIDL